ncbi:unnamed protein product [Calicophoron daubneyi]|uniref:PIPK domain-containing protein n=1 Tax=Calicophoron daubneyi TaxID=300641 RepID=A0AAV2TS43_CALDB
MTEAVTRNSGPSSPLSQTSPVKSGMASTSRGPFRESEIRKERKLGHRRVTEEGTVTYKKKPTSEIQRALQLGIQHHIGTVQQKPLRDVLFSDFQTLETVCFPPAGTKTTPAHNMSEFRFRTYAPIAFRNFRNRYKLDIRDFLNSICGRELRELSNPGASGSIFYITQDDEFIIKTVQHREGEFLVALLPPYFMNLMQHPCTLLPKFHGFYCLQTSRKNIRFVVMNNLLPSAVKIHEKYDLKGSTYKRRAGPAELAKSSPTLKDLDFRERHPDGIWLETETYDALIKTIEEDCRVLESLQIMDYSLLLGIHNLDQAKRERTERHSLKTTQGAAGSPASCGDEARSRSDGHTPVNGVHLDSSEVSRVDLSSLPRFPVSSGVSGLHATPHSLSPGADGERNVSFRPPGVIDNSVSYPENRVLYSPKSSGFQRNVGRARSHKRLAAYSTAMESIEASAKPVELEKEEVDLIPSGGIPARSSNGDRLLLFIGIIDILQSYRLAKKLEHGFKSLVIDGETVSVSPPDFYAQRFQDSLSRVVFKRIQSLDQPTLLGPNAMRFRRFVEMAMKQVSAKRSAATSRQSSTMRPSGELQPPQMYESHHRSVAPATSS